MDRRTFLTQATVFAALSGAAVRITGCSSDDGGMGVDDPGNGGESVSGVVGTNHGHVVVLAGAQIDDGQRVTLTLSCVGHEHSLALTADEVMEIGERLRVGPITSSQEQFHTHSVTFN